jgi:uncharacterized membrane protein
MTLKNRLILLFFVFCNTILLVFLCNMVLALQSDIASLKGDLATKQDLATMKVGDVQPLLDEKCTRCHSERKFAGLHGTELQAALTKMERIKDARLSAQEVDKVHASLVMERCLACHSKDVIKELALKSKMERDEIISRMRQKEGAGLQDVDVQTIEKSFEQIYGF